MDNDHEQHDRDTKKAIIENIERYGCHLALVAADNYLPPFVYSIGLYGKFGQPEIICFGLKQNVLAHIVKYAADLIMEGERIEVYRKYAGFLEGFEVQFIPVEKTFYPDYFGYAGWYYDNTFDFPALQVVWPDMQSRFPWEENFNPDWKFKQPLLDRNTDFKFFEERNLGVYTTKQAFDGDPILYVYHNDDGDWQFHTSENPDLNDAMLVSLHEIVKLDPTLNEIHYLQLGWSAWRENIGEEWASQEDENEKD